VIILFSVISWLILGLIYNTVARHVLYGDATILAITHYALPSFSASLLTGASISSAATLSGFMFVTFGFIMESRNLKDTKEDAERGYKTLTTVFKEGKLISVTLIASSVICMFLSYFLFSLSLLFLFAFLTVIFSYLKVIFHITRKENSDAVKFLRVLMMLFLISFILGKSTHFLVILFSISLFLAYLILLSIDKMILARTQEEKALL
jgi:4-hydroxybenzoate polyprenyltransferase